MRMQDLVSKIYLKNTWTAFFFLSGEKAFELSIPKNKSFSYFVLSKILNV